MRNGQPGESSQVVTAELELLARSAGISASWHRGVITGAGPDGDIALAPGILLLAPIARQGVLAHEVAHLALGHLRARQRRDDASAVLALLTGLGLWVLGAPVTWCFAGFATAAALGIVVAPIARRRDEIAADAYGARIGSRLAMVAAIEALEPGARDRQNGKGRTAPGCTGPLRWWYRSIASHPSSQRRLALLG